MKKLLYLLLITPLFFISSCEEQGPIHGCSDSQALNYNSEASIDNNSCEYLQIEIGSIFQGGIVFYVDETGEHGLVAALEDMEGAYEWGCFELEVDGADETSIGTGYQNTIDIVGQNCQTQNGEITAAQTSLNYESEGYSDWYLPSKDELDEMYNTIGNGSLEGNIGGFAYTWYWSSSENNLSGAWSVFFMDGYSYGGNKNPALLVRVVRTF